MSFDGGGFDGGNFGGGGGFDSFGGAQAFDNGGGFEGGGGGFQNFSSSQQSPSTAKKRGEQTLMPVTIKQINDADSNDSKFRVDGKELSSITFVAMILDVNVGGTHISYMMDDGTGKINVRIYLSSGDNEADTAQHQQFGKDMYARVVGNVREFNGDRTVTGFQALLPVTDHDEITTHYLEAIHAHLLNTKGDGKSNMNMEGGMNNNNSNMNSNMNDMYSNNNAGQHNMQNDETANMTPIQQQLISVFKQFGDGDDGCSIDFVCTKFPQLTRAQITECVGQLGDDGFLYSTIDEDHFKSTDS